MNSCDERIEKTLNRAGQTISDLPNGYLLNAGEAKAIQGVACRWFVDEDAPEGVALRNLVSIPLYQYILHLTDIIDRMELALENVCGERDYLVWALKIDNHCAACIYRGKYLFEEPCLSCENRSEFEWSIPEDWSVDDETSNA